MATFQGFEGEARDCVRVFHQSAQSANASFA